MEELLKGGRLKRILDPLVIKALGHPVREHILAVLNERVASATEIGEELGADVSAFYHHVEELERLGCIERVETRKRRGASEHFFRAKQAVFFDDAAWAELPESLKGDLTNSFVQSIFDDVVAALKAKTLDARDDRHVSWVPGLLDARAWRQSMELMEETLGRLIEIQDESALRLAKSEEEGIATTFAILAFEAAGQQDRPG